MCRLCVPVDDDNETKEDVEEGAREVNGKEKLLFSPGPGLEACIEG